MVEAVNDGRDIQRENERVDADVFISYKRSDRPKIAALSSALEQMGVRVWFDLSLRAGDRFDDVIEANAKACRAMVVCWTSACFADDDSGYVRWEAGIGRGRGVLAPITLERPATIQFADDWDRLHVEDLSHWLIASDDTRQSNRIENVGEHGSLSDPAFMRLLYTLGEPHLLNRPGLAELSRVYAALQLAGDPEHTGPRAELTAAVKIGRDWLIDHKDDPAAEKLARSLVDYEYAALGAGILHDYGRLLGNWTPPGAEAMRRERGLERRIRRLELEQDGKEQRIAYLEVALGEARDTTASLPIKRGIFGRVKTDQDGTVRHATEVSSPLTDHVDRSRPGHTWRDSIEGLDTAALPEMVTLPTGTFMMGSPASENGSSDSERPQHQVTLAHPIAFGVYPVTFDQWDAARSAGAKIEDPKDMGWGRGDRPVINVSWQDTQTYLHWLNTELGLVDASSAYRLPSEAEWEYACRAGTTTPYSTGDTITTREANFHGDKFVDKTVPVGSYAANPFGLYDMHGNVWEWVEDCWNNSYEGAPEDGSAWLSGDSDHRVLRGGSWYYSPQFLRSAVRLRGNSSYRYDSIGFRIARTL